MCQARQFQALELSLSSLHISSADMCAAISESSHDRDGSGGWVYFVQIALSIFVSSTEPHIGLGESPSLLIGIRLLPFEPCEFFMVFFLVSFA